MKKELLILKENFEFYRLQVKRVREELMLSKYEWEKDFLTPELLRWEDKLDDVRIKINRIYNEVKYNRLSLE